MDRFDYALWGAKAMAVRGESLPHSKLDADSVRVIRANADGLTARQLAAIHGVHYRTIEKVRHFQSWSHIK